MNKQHIPLLKPVGLGFSAFFRALPKILVFEVLYNMAASLVIKPLLSVIMRIFLSFSGSGPAFNDRIWGFAFSIPGILAILILAGLAIIFILFEFSVVIHLIRQSLEKNKPLISYSAKCGIWALRGLGNADAVFFALYSLFLMPVVNMGVTSSLLPAINIPNFITGELTKTRAGEWGLLFAVIAFACLFFCLVFVLPAMSLERMRFLKAAKRSFSSIRIYGVKILGVFIVYLILWLLLFLAPRLTFDYFIGTPNAGYLQIIRHFGFSFLTPLMLLVRLVSSLAQYLLMPLLLSVLTACYIPVWQPENVDEKIVANIGERLNKWASRAGTLLQKIVGVIWNIFNRIRKLPIIQKHKKLTVFLLLAAIILLIVLLNFNQLTRIHDPIVIGHRGCAYAVENTLEAIEQAADAGANYAEVDVLLSSDGVPMVIHDINLKRLSGMNVNVYEMTAEELSKVTISQKGRTGRIPTLDEVVDYCEGKILLTVELKTHGFEQADLVEKVMECISKSSYQKNCMFISMEYELILQMEEQYPEYKTGYCVYGNVGLINTKSIVKMNIDCLVVEEWMMSESLVSACRKAWTPVYVWTVNDTKNMERYLKMGADGLITDYPDSAAKTVSEMFPSSILNDLMPSNHD